MIDLSPGSTRGVTAVHVHHDDGAGTALSYDILKGAHISAVLMFVRVSVLVDRATIDPHTAVRVEASEEVNCACNYVVVCGK